MTTRYEAIPAPVLKELRETDDAGRATVGYEDAEGGAPLRCCLRKSAAGDRVALVSYAPLLRWAADEGIDPGAYLELGPIFIHSDECDGPADGYPHELHAANRVFRAYDRKGRIRGGVVVEPGRGEAAAKEWFTDSEVAVIHARAVEFGCFMFEVRR
ncbi:MAG TPA: DUF1203 domain-containing protein [Micromonosporaceae bacterium]|nr:DUF1203 domain-containing protein [Micromonosporaceae bacterium]HCU48871.1 DUF1203 domain-containing protein [Micromonosporaceae bacterium]